MLKTDSCPVVESGGGSAYSCMSGAAKARVSSFLPIWTRATCVIHLNLKSDVPKKLAITDKQNCRVWVSTTLSFGYVLCHMTQENASAGASVGLVAVRCCNVGVNVTLSFFGEGNAALVSESRGDERGD